MVYVFPSYGKIKKSCKRYKIKVNESNMMLPNIKKNIEKIKDVGVKYLLSINPKIYKPEECPMCKNGVDITKPGSRNI